MASACHCDLILSHSPVAVFSPRFSLLLLDLEEYYFEQHTAHHVIGRSRKEKER